LPGSVGSDTLIWEHIPRFIDDMRAVFFATMLAVLAPFPVVAQTATSTAPAAPKPARGGDIARSEYIEHAVDRARKAAAARFDRMDANHDGILTADERRAARASRRSSKSEAQ
jgi:hypothetical protein